MEEVNSIDNNCFYLKSKRLDSMTALLPSLVPNIINELLGASAIELKTIAYPLTKEKGLSVMGFDALLLKTTKLIELSHLSFNTLLNVCPEYPLTSIGLKRYSFKSVFVTRILPDRKSVV